MIRCIAVDDEPLALRKLEKYIGAVSEFQLEGAFNSAEKALVFLEDHSADVIFADIHMPDMNGLEFVKSLVQRPQIVFTTAYDQYALEGFKVDALDYLLKPISFSDFERACSKVRERVMLQRAAHPEVQAAPDYLFIKSEYKILRINYSEIIYLESQREYVRIFLENQKPIMTLMSMKKMQTILPASQFMRIHRSYIVALGKIRVIEKSQIFLNEKKSLPIGEQYKEVFQKYIEKNFWN